MNLILHLTPEIETELKERAGLAGWDPEAFALEAIKDRLANGDDARGMLPYDAWKTKFDELLASMPRGNPKADFDRATVYEGRGE